MSACDRVPELPDPTACSRLPRSPTAMLLAGLNASVLSVLWFEALRWGFRQRATVGLTVIRFSHFSPWRLFGSHGKLRSARLRA